MSQPATNTRRHAAADLVLALNESLSSLLARTRKLLRSGCLAMGDARDLRRIERQALACRLALRDAVAEETRHAPRTMVLRAEEVLIRALEWAEPRARVAGVKVSISFQPGLPRIMGDPVALEHAFLLVLVDALRSEGGAVHLMAERATLDGRPAVRIVVADDRGTPPATSLPDLRAIGQSRGLAVARDVVVDHGGAFTFRGDGGGLSVELHLPGLTSMWATT